MYNIHTHVRFVWDDIKQAENCRKHDVSFEEAATIFFNVPLHVFHDRDHSENEDRYIAAGFSNRGRILVVIHCENRAGSEIRIISARLATRPEQKELFGGILR